MRLPETREEDASPKIKAIYADMRRTMRLPLVNLIYRYLATVPGVLPHTWAFVRDMMVSGALDAALLRLTQNLPVPQLAPFASGVLNDDERVAVACVLDAYNRGNGLNVIALTAMRMDVHQRAPVLADLPDGAFGDGAPAIARLLRFEELPRDVAKTVTEISALHEGMNGVIPSLYLHLANWPAFLDAACDWIVPALQDGSMARARRIGIEKAVVEAKALVAQSENAAKVEGFPAEVLATIDTFITYVIPEMLPIGIALDRALSPDRR